MVACLWRSMLILHMYCSAIDPVVVGDIVTVELKGTVIKRSGTRLRIETATGSQMWIESREIVSRSGDNTTARRHSIVESRSRIFLKSSHSGSSSNHNNHNNCSDMDGPQSSVYQRLPAEAKCVEIEPIPIIDFRRTAHASTHGWPEGVIYKGSVVDMLQYKGKYVYIDLGANTYDSSIGNWFMKHYPKSKQFEIWAFETETAYDATYQGHPNVHLLHYAVWYQNGTLPWAKNWYAVADGRTTSTESTRPTIDIADFISRTVKPDDYLVVKMDIEGAEYQVVPHLLRSTALGLIDEIFIEVHTEVNRCCTPPNDAGRHWEDAMRLVRDLRGAGLYAHMWG